MKRWFVCIIICEIKGFYLWWIKLINWDIGKVICDMGGILVSLLIINGNSLIVDF